jgi:hypothetical protein
MAKAPELKTPADPFRWFDPSAEVIGLVVMLCLRQAMPDWQEIALTWHQRNFCRRDHGGNVELNVLGCAPLRRRSPPLA